MSREFFNAKIREQIKRHNRTGDNFTIGEFINAVMKIENKEDAKLFADGYLDYLTEHRTKEHEPGDVMRSNIGWCFGEGMGPEKINMWIEVSKASHPIFGTKLPTFDEAFNAGIKAGQEQGKH